MQDLTTAGAAHLIATSDLETEQERYLRVLHCVLDRRRPDSTDLVRAIWLCHAIDTGNVPLTGSGLVQLALLWRPLLLIARVYYSCLEIAA